MRRIQTFFLLLFTCPLIGQDLTGTWEGIGGTGAPYLQLVILKVGDDYVGYTYDIDRTGYCKANFTGKFDPASAKLKGKGTGFIERTYNHILCVYNLTYSYSDGIHYLQGSAQPKAAALKIFSLGDQGSVRLTKVDTKVDTTDFIREQIFNSAPAPTITNTDTIVKAPASPVKLEETIIAIKNERTNDTLSIIPVSENKVRLKIYDNGITDGDSISVLYNNKLIAANIRVSDVVVEIPLDLEVGTTTHIITLVAHNLGSIPPNTATIVIEDGNKKHTLVASSDLKKNNSIIIKYKDPTKSD